ncbi:hypothetical protein EC991_004336 [Linnemannia zychae]|nr:hypothetical protein EC991_004336 [Linnemannia zychae]
MATTASYAELLSSRPKAKLHFALPTESTSVDNNLEDMMTESVTAGTPPLDPGSDSDPESFPLSPSTFQPFSILQRKRKDSQEEHISALNLFDRQRGQHDAEYAALPSVEGYGKGARGRRPTVTFDLDDEPSSSQQQQHTGLLPVAHPHRRRHDDVEGFNPTHNRVDFSLDADSDKTHQKQSLGHDMPDSLAAELRRVSITLPNEPLPSASETLSTTTTTTATIAATSIATTTTTTATTTTSITSSVENENSTQPQEIILNHINTETVPQDLLVALFDRSSELEALAVIHSDFFNLIYSSLSKSTREPFKTLLFTPRSALGDLDWMRAIEQHLCPLPPCILEKFKGIVGWIGPEGDDDEDDCFWGEDEYGYRDSSFEQVQIKWLRDVPDFPLETFQQCYPQFFVNARERLHGRRMSHGGDQRDHYVIFCETLGLNRDDLPCDSAWARRMNGCLEKHPELLLQLKEIIAYETGYDD